MPPFRALPVFCAEWLIRRLRLSTFRRLRQIGFARIEHCLSPHVGFEGECFIALRVTELGILSSHLKDGWESFAGEPIAQAHSMTDGKSLSLIALAIDSNKFLARWKRRPSVIALAHPVIPSIASSIFFRKCFWILGTSRNVGKRTSADWAKYSTSPV